MLVLAILILFARMVSAGETASLQLKFIGNTAFRITDGKTLLFTDFPYTSGAFGYMAYNANEASPYPEALCLITHAHADHWNAELFTKMNSALIAPAEILKTVKSGTKIPFAGRMQYRNIVVHAIKTPHAGEHYSYLVEWVGFRLYFAGDTEDTTQLLNAKNLDVAFVTPWLLASLKSSNKKIDAKRIVVYHHTANEKITEYQDRFVPKQNETLQLSKPS